MGTADSRQALGALIRDRRLSYDNPLKQRELASKIGVDPITVSRWERGITIPSDVHRVLLTRALGGHPSDYQPVEEVAA